MLDYTVLSRKHVIADTVPGNLNASLQTRQNVSDKSCRIMGVYENTLREVFRTYSWVRGGGLPNPPHAVRHMREVVPIGYGAIAPAVTAKPGEERTARSTGRPQDGRSDHPRPRRRSGYLMTHPYGRV